ncbi:Carrier protein YMC1, mitochondrial [Saitozyma sp. JCM 24511]|nr:Carrier protein YMC1, mitochondrial [Saitozyma sp. JCM 24511]
MSELLSPPPDSPGLRLTQTQKDLVGGSVGGVAQVLVGQPFDIVKVRVQTAPPGTYASPLDCATKLLKADGPLGFYKGTLTPLLGIGACVSIQFGALEWAKRTFGSRKLPGQELNLAELWASGAIAGVANTAVANPVEHIRIRLQTQPEVTPRLYAGPLDCAIKLYRQGGMSGLFKGQVSTMWRDGVGYGSYFMAYEWLVQRHIRVNGVKREEISPLWAVTFGAAAGYALWASIYPVDVIKSKLQTDSLDPSKRQYRGMVDCAIKVWRAQGLKGFTGGLAPTLIRSPFANGATFVAFELAMRGLA